MRVLYVALLQRRICGPCADDPESLGPTVLAANGGFAAPMHDLKD